MNRLLRIGLTFTWLAAAGCSKNEPVPPPAPENPAMPVAKTPAVPELGGRVWLADQVNGAALPLPADARVPSIEFDTAAKTANGFAGCNTFNGAYTQTGEFIHLGPFATTRRACADLDAIEHTFLAAMAQTRTFRVTKDTLEFIGRDGNAVVSFEARPF